MKQVATLAVLVIVALMLGVRFADAGIKQSTLISKTDTTKTYFHSLGYAVGTDQRVQVTVQVPHTSVTADYVEFAFDSDTTNLVRVYKGTPAWSVDGVATDSIYVKGSATGLTFFITVVKK